MSDAPRMPSAWELERAVSQWQQLREMLRSDDQLFDDEVVTLPDWHGGTHAGPHQLLAELIDVATWCERREAEADKLRSDMIERRDRYRDRLARIRDTIGQLMATLGLPSHRGTLGAASMATGPQAVIITDADLLPDDCCRIERTPVKSLIRARMEAGQDVPGAVLSNPEPVLRIRKL